MTYPRINLLGRLGALEGRVKQVAAFASDPEQHLKSLSELRGDANERRQIQKEIKTISKKLVEHPQTKSYGDRLRLLAQALMELQEPAPAKNPQSEYLLRMRVKLHDDLLSAGIKFEDLRRAIERSDDEALAKCWADLRDLEKELQSLFKYHQIVIHALVARSAGLNDSTVQIADELLRLLSPRRGGYLTLLSDSDSFSDSTKVIGLRFPEPTLWSLPILAHELGHAILLGAEFGAVADLRQKHARQDPVLGRHFHEVFADAFATWTMGPAFGAACLLLRFDPQDAYRLRPTHPSTAQRAYCILQQLETTAKSVLPVTRKRRKDTGAKWENPFPGLVSELRGRWTEIVSSAGESLTQKELDDLLERDRLNEWLNEICEVIDHLCPQYAWYRACAIAENLMSTSKVIPGDVNLIDALNGGWLVRLREESHIRNYSPELDNKVRALCWEIIIRPLGYSS